MLTFHIFSFIFITEDIEKKTLYTLDTIFYFGFSFLLFSEARFLQCQIDNICMFVKALMIILVDIFLAIEPIILIQ